MFKEEESVLILSSVIVVAAAYIIIPENTHNIIEKTVRRWQSVFYASVALFVIFNNLF